MKYVAATHPEVVNLGPDLGIFSNANKGVCLTTRDRFRFNAMRKETGKRKNRADYFAASADDIIAAHKRSAISSFWREEEVFRFMTR